MDENSTEIILNVRRDAQPLIAEGNFDWIVPTLSTSSNSVDSRPRSIRVDLEKGFSPLPYARRLLKAAPFLADADVMERASHLSNQDFNTLIDEILGSDSQLLDGFEDYALSLGGYGS